MGFIVAHNRDRDSYQVPLALAEVGQLRRFVTDYYVGSTRVAVPTLGHRRHVGIAPALVTSSWPALAAQLPYEVGRRLRPVDFPSYLVESALGRTTAAVAKRMPDADLLLYSGSARPAFAGPSRGRRILFQYHPSPAFIESVVAEVDELADIRNWTQEAEVHSPGMERAHREEIERADRFLCASTFTKVGLVRDGVDPNRIRIAPYGSPAPTSRPAPAPSEQCRFLFVGQGVARKGLHLLIEAWRQAALPAATLTLVTSRLDPEMTRFAEGVPGIEFVGRLSRTDLDATMNASDTLVLPSLVEGFGLVLGEGLSFGLRLMASTHTGLVDMDLPPHLSRVVDSGRVAPLAEALLDAAASYDPARPYRADALQAAQRLSWANFRQRIREGVQP